MEPRARSPRLLGRRTLAWSTSALWNSTSSSFVRSYSCSRPTPGSGRHEARGESSMRLVQHGSVFTASPALANPYTIRLLTYCMTILIVHQQSGNRIWRCGLFIPAFKDGASKPISCKGKNRCRGRRFHSHHCSLSPPRKRR